MALHKQTVSPDDAAASESTQVSRELVLPVQSWSVAPLDNGMLVLILDQGLDTELMLGLTPEVAETLANLFIKHAGASGESSPA
jgi:hypothetical protein